MRYLMWIVAFVAGFFAAAVVFRLELGAPLTPLVFLGISIVPLVLYAMPRTRKLASTAGAFVIGLITLPLYVAYILASVGA